MNLQDLVLSYQEKFQVVDVIDLDAWYDIADDQKEIWMKQTVSRLYQPVFDPDQRIIFTLSRGEEYEHAHHRHGKIFPLLQKTLNLCDISNYFVVILTNDQENLENHKSISLENYRDPVAWTWDIFDHPAYPGKNFKKSLPIHTSSYDYNSVRPVKLDMNSMEDRHRDLLLKSKTFCMYPWMHLHAYPTGDVWPCCHAEMSEGPVGSCRTHPLSEIWNSERMKKLRVDMLSGKPNPICNKCYEQESSGFFGGRLSANKHHGHHIRLVDKTQPDGHLDQFTMTYWDVRFSNLCNLKCRSCGYIFSSQWYQDQVKIAGEHWARNNKPLIIAGRDDQDMWNQLLPHIDHVEQIYFAGGEPLLMEEHYHILEELEKRGKFDVRLIYNTNFTQVRLKDRLVFDYWKKFRSVSVGASLDAQGIRGEYIRKGSDWQEIEDNRKLMLAICPQVDFYISPTLSIMNAWHLPDFHRDWTERGLIRAQDLNVNILQDPSHYRIDIAPMKYKQRLRIKFEEHIDWLKSRDRLKRATVGFESAIKFMIATDNSHLLPVFKKKTQRLDEIRKESLLDNIPELEQLYHESTA